MRRTPSYGFALSVCVLAASVAVGSQAPSATAAPPAGAPGTPPAGPDMNAFYQLGPYSLPHDGVPKGEVRGPFVLPSQAYPGTQHTYWLHVPAQYNPAVPASLMIFQDGQAFKDMGGSIRAPNVLDNLIYLREIPVMITVFINPGRTPEQPEPTPQEWGDRTTNRPAEYNSLDDKYARVVVDELLPVLYKDYNLSRDPDRHGIGGASSGAIAAFTVAWQRPTDFHKVLSIVGSFTNLRGGDAYADLVRQSEKKPIRIFLQDGRNDNRGVGRGGAYDQRRDWFYQNVRLMQALTDKGYDVNYAWGLNTHGQRMGGPMLPEMMRWLWRDHPVSTDVNDAVERSFNEPSLLNDLKTKGAAATPVPLSRAHAHNDYEHPRPLFDALDRGFPSVEADVWLVDGQLLVAHDRDAIRADRTLQALYLNPLRDRVTRNGGRVYPNGPEFLLWIDVKSDAEPTYVALRSVLAMYPEMVTVFRTDRVDPKAVRVIISGNRARDTMEHEAVRYAALDGRLPDLQSTASSSLIPVVSDNWQDVFQWRGTGPFPPEERAKLRSLVEQAHRQQRQIRFWAIPDQREGWQECLDASVDLINTDDLDGLRTFLIR